MSLTEPSGWDPFEAKWWPVIAASIPRPWPREAVWADLRWWAARERMGDGKRPGRPALEQRWGLTGHAARVAMLSEDVWGDPRTSTANRQPTDSESPADRQAARVRTTAIAEKPTADRQPTDSEPTANRPTRVGSQSTEHRAQSTGETEIQDAPVPVGPSVKPKPPKVKPSPDQPSDSERQAFDDALGAIAEIDHGAALRIDAGTSGALRKSLLAALRRDGDIVTVRRLRYVARSGDGLDLCARVGGPGVGPLLHDPKRANPRTGGPCWAAQLDDKAAAMVATPGGSRTLAHDTDARWRDPGWTPTRTAQQPPARPGKPAQQDPLDRMNDSLDQLRQLREAANGSRLPRNDADDLRRVATVGDAPARRVVVLDG